MARACSGVDGRRSRRRRGGAGLLASGYSGLVQAASTAASANTMRTPTLPFTELMAETYSTRRAGAVGQVYSATPSSASTAAATAARRVGVVAAVLERVGTPTIQRGKGFRRVEIVGQIPAHPRDHVRRIGTRRQRGRGPPARQTRLRLGQNGVAPGPVGTVVPGQQTQPDGGRVDAVGPQPGHQHQVAAALAHLVAVPADHARVHVVAGESPLPRDGFGVRGRELVMREDQVAAAALHVETGADAGQGDRRTLDVPAGPARAER